MKSLVSLTMTALLLSVAASAAVYKSTDKYGNVVYTDNPTVAAESGRSEKVAIPDTNVVPSSKAIETHTPPKQHKPKAAQAKTYRIHLVSPTDQYTVTAGQRDLIIAVATDRPLEHGAQIAYFMDGKQLGKTAVNNYSIHEIIRGTHKLSAKVVSPKGKTLGTSKTVTVFVHRPTLYHPPR